MSCLLSSSHLGLLAFADLLRLLVSRSPTASSPCPAPDHLITPCDASLRLGCASPHLTSPSPPPHLLAAVCVLAVLLSQCSAHVTALLAVLARPLPGSLVLVPSPCARPSCSSLVLVPRARPSCSLVPLVMSRVSYGKSVLSMLCNANHFY